MFRLWFLMLFCFIMEDRLDISGRKDKPNVCLYTVSAKLWATGDPTQQKGLFCDP